MKRFLSVMILLAFLFGLASCSSGSDGTGSAVDEDSAAEAESEEETVSYTAQVFAMDTYIDLTGYGSAAEAAIEEIAGRIEELDALLSVTSEDSEVYALNHAGGEALTVSETTAELIAFTQTLSAQTNGALDITVYPLMLAWGFTTEEYQIPSDEAISALLPYVDESQITVDGTTVTVPADMQLDLGAVVKGYACDLAGSILEEYGVEHALLNFGGSTINLVGTKVDGSSWRVAIQDPEDESAYAGILEVTDCIIDTSGGYERYFTDEDGNVYWHIIDPDTGYPADSGLISVTIISEEGITGDALSTACFVMGLEETIEYWRTSGDFEFVLITEDHDLYVSEGIADSFTPTGDYSDASLTVVQQ